MPRPPFCSFRDCLSVASLSWPSVVQKPSSPAPGTHSCGTGEYSANKPHVGCAVLRTSWLSFVATHHPEPHPFSLPPNRCSPRFNFSAADIAARRSRPSPSHIDLSIYKARKDCKSCLFILFNNSRIRAIEQNEKLTSL